MELTWSAEAWEGYVWWQSQDRKTLRRINDLVKGLMRSGGDGQTIGKPERLRYSTEGLCSLRIDQTNRLVYKVDGDRVRIVSCRGHY